MKIKKSGSVGQGFILGVVMILFLSMAVTKAQKLYRLSTKNLGGEISGLVASQGKLIMQNHLNIFYSEDNGETWKLPRKGIEPHPDIYDLVYSNGSDIFRLNIEKCW